MVERVVPLAHPAQRQLAPGPPQHLAQRVRRRRRACRPAPRATHRRRLRSGSTHAGRCGTGASRPARSGRRRGEPEAVVEQRRADPEDDRRRRSGPARGRGSPVSSGGNPPARRSKAVPLITRSISVLIVWNSAISSARSATRTSSPATTPAAENGATMPAWRSARNGTSAASEAAGASVSALVPSRSTSVGGSARSSPAQPVATRPAPATAPRARKDRRVLPVRAARSLTPGRAYRSAARGTRRAHRGRRRARPSAPA